jgi:hypothetical protein
LTQLLVLLLCVSLALAQTPVPAQRVFTQQELDQMLAPIALYPDSLLSQILMASTYPIEIVQAARWSRANPNLIGDQAVRAVEQNDWDPSVKSLVAFPQILGMLDAKLDWMERLGEAFLVQQQAVMDTVQDLRRKALGAGNLTSNQQLRVEPQGETIIIESANPQVVHVPYYDPYVVYGSWWWPDYPPVFWAPWPGYYVGPGYGATFYWGTGIFLGAGFFFGAFDWPHRHVTIVNVDNYYYRPRSHDGPAERWEHDPGHRRGVPFRHPDLRERFGHRESPSDARRAFRGHEPDRLQVPDMGRTEARGISDGRAPRDRSHRDETARSRAPDASRPEARGVPIRPNSSAAPVNPNVSGSPRALPRSVPAPALPSPSASPPTHIFEGVGRGAEARYSSARGHNSSERIAPAARPRNASPVPRQGRDEPSAEPSRNSGKQREQRNR